MLDKKSAGILAVAIVSVCLGLGVANAVTDMDESDMRYPTNVYYLDTGESKPVKMIEYMPAGNAALRCMLLLDPKGRAKTRPTCYQTGNEEILQLN